MTQERVRAVTAVISTLVTGLSMTLIRSQSAKAAIERLLKALIQVIEALPNSIEDINTIVEHLKGGRPNDPTNL